MALKISLRKSYKGEGFSADIRSPEGYYAFTVAEGVPFTPKDVCAQAAQRLREAADKFDALSQADNPLELKTQRAINKKDEE